MTRTIVAVVIYNRFSNLERWVACWKQCATDGAELVVVHNHYGDESAKEKYSAYCAQHGIRYVPRLGEGYDIGAFQDVCRDRLTGFPDYDYLLWCTDDCIPMQKDFIAPFLSKLSAPGIGISCMKLYTYAGVGPWYPDHVRTTGFCLRKKTAQDLTFPVDPIQTKDHCWDFEVRAGRNTLYGQILSMGLVPGVVAPDSESPLWDTEFDGRLPRQMEHDLIFSPSLPETANPGFAGVVVAVVIYNRFSNLEQWIACWKQCNTQNAQLVIVHNHYGDTKEKEKYEQYCAKHCITYVPRSGGGYDIGAFQDVCRNRLPGFPGYEYLLWCTDDCIPMRKDFIRPFVSALLDPRIGVSCIQISSEWAPHIRTTGFCLRKATAEALTFPEDPILTKEHCFAFEHRAGEGTFYRQILRMGLVPVTVAPDAESPLWDSEFRDRFGKILSVDPRQIEHDQMFGPSNPASACSAERSAGPMNVNIYHDVPVFIVCRDRLAPLQQLVEWLERTGHTNIVLVDNASTYPPLLEFLESCPHHVVSLPENVGHLAVWTKSLQTQFVSKTLPGFYVVSDCDVVPDERCPGDVTKRLYSILREHPNMDKAGLGLKIDDLPDCFQFKREVIDWESQFWETPLEPDVYDAPIDTTFALYRPGTTHHSIFRSIRTGGLYTARHLPWYQNSANLTVEELYYRQHMSKNIGSWGHETLPPDLAHAIEERRRGMESK